MSESSARGAAIGASHELAAAPRPGTEPGHAPLVTPVQLTCVFALLFALRAASMLASGAGLHVDEAQYWDWSRHLEWGYFSKPPLTPALIALSTFLFGDGLFGVRAWAMLCWLGASLVLWQLGRDMGSPRAGLWAALLLASTPASGLLGLVATTDAPLMLMWALLMATSWRALNAQHSAWHWWALAGLCLGLGLLAKYTMAAASLSLLWLVWLERRSSAWLGLGLAFTLAAMVLSPNLLWNAANHWQTWRHTAEITTGTLAEGGLSWLTATLEYLAGQLLLAGPVLLWIAVRAQRCRAMPATPSGHFAIAFSVPLLLIGLVQAARSGAQLNWTAPALLGLCLWLGHRAAQAKLGWRLGLSTLAIGVALSCVLVLGGDLRRFVSSDTTRAPWDVWARMRGWEQAFASARPLVEGFPDAVLAATQRDLLAQAAYAWRDMNRPVWSWKAPTPPRHHYDTRRGLSLGGADTHPTPTRLLLLSNTEPLDTAPFAHHELLWQGSAGRSQLQLWLLANPGGSSKPGGRE